MRKLAKLVRLPRRDAGLLAAAALALCVCVLAVRVVSFRKLARTVTRLTPGVKHPVEDTARERVSWAIQTAARYIPGATCLPQALAAGWLLGRFGEPCRIRIGVAKTDQGKLQAHAWVECRNEVVVGGFAALDRYAPLPDVQS